MGVCVLMNNYPGDWTIKRIVILGCDYLSINLPIGLSEVDLSL